MNNQKDNYSFRWLKSDFKILSLSFIFIILLLGGLFGYFIIPFGYIAYSLFTVILFYWGTVKLLPKLENNSNKIQTNLFWLSFFINLFLIILIYLYYYFIVESPYGALFGPGAQDATGYHYISTWLAEDFLANGSVDIEKYKNYYGSYSDMGYVFWTSFWYILFGPYLWLHGLFNLIVSSWSVVLMYKIAKLQYNYKIAIITAIMMIFYPGFYLFISQSLKEILLIWLLLQSVKYIQRVLLSVGNNSLNIIFAFLFIISIGLFRTFLVALLLIAFFSALYVNPNPKIRRYRSLYIILGLSAVVGLGGAFGLTSEIENAANTSSESFDGVVSRRNESSLTSFATLPVYLIAVIPGPISSFVETGEQRQIWLTSGSLFIRNAFMFYYLIGIYFLIKTALRKNLFIIIIILGYLFTMAYSGYATTSRYHVIILPILLMFSAIGMGEVTPVQHKWFGVFVFGISFITIMWNYLKLYGAGLV